MWHKIIKKIQHLLAANSRPVMMAQKRNFQRKKLVNTRISSSTFLDHKETLFLSDHVYIGHFNFIEASQNVFIGEGVQITNFVNITTHSSHHSIRLYGRHYAEFADKVAYVKGEIKIGAYTFVGPYSLIMPGATIGRGCVIAAYSLVKGSFPDYSIIAGSPAKVVGNTKNKDQEFLEKHPELRAYYYDK